MGNSGQYYTNGDWTDLTTVYRREDYYKTEEFKNFSDNGEVGDPKPEGYPTNDVGGDAEGKLPSYNAGVYTTLSWTGFEMFGRSWCRNYGIDSVISVPRVTTYVEIWRVEPNLSLAMDTFLSMKSKSQQGWMIQQRITNPQPQLRHYPCQRLHIL